MLFERKEIRLAAPGGAGFSPLPFLASLLIHGLLAYLMMTWTFSQTPESVTRVVVVHIVEERQEKPPVSPAPVRLKPKKAQEVVRPIPAPQPVIPRKEEEAPSPTVVPAAGKSAPEVLQVHEEKVGVEEKPKEKWMEKVEPRRWGNPEEPQESEPLRQGKEEPPMSLSEESGSASEGVPGGLAAVNAWGRGAGGDDGFPGGTEGGKGTIPPKGAKTGSVYFQGEGKGRRDLGSYLGNARMKIEKAKRYPVEAQKKKWEGRVVLSFQINRHGEVLEIKLIQSSGYRLLDNEGIMTLRRASPFPSPLLIEKENLVLEVPIHFKLEKKP
jgi:protein TonB